MMWVKERKGCRMNCDVGEAAEVLENKMLRTRSTYDVGEATEML